MLEAESAQERAHELIAAGLIVAVIFAAKQRSQLGL
jgi:hypothetical protein